MQEELYPHIADSKQSRELIMLVDDDAMVIRLVECMLANAGYRVITALSPSQAIQLYKMRHAEVRLVITDYKMPDMDGFALFKELRLINPQAQVVLTSGFIDEDHLKAMLAQGLSGFIPKPISQQNLLVRLRSILDAIHCGEDTAVPNRDVSSRTASAHLS